MKTPIELFGVECGKGWYPLIRPILNYIEEYNSGKDGSERIELTQVKEKWGFLHVYTSRTTEELRKLISDAEQKSKTICEVCGNPGILRKVDGWYRTLCESCSQIVGEDEFVMKSKSGERL